MYEDLHFQTHFRDKNTLYVNTLFAEKFTALSVKTIYLKMLTSHWDQKAHGLVTTSIFLLNNAISCAVTVVFGNNFGLNQEKNY